MMNRHSILRFLAAVFPFLLSTGCALYHPQPLPESPNLIKDLSHFPERALLESKGVRFEDGINSSEFLLIALEMSPDLKLARDDELISQRNISGNSPESQITLGYGEILGQPIGTFDTGVGFDVRSLISTPSRRRQEKAERRRGSLAREWQEFQIAEAARVLFAKYHYQNKMLEILDEAYAILSEKIAKMDEALKAGDVSMAIVAVELSARGDLNSKRHDAEKSCLQTRVDIHRLLGFDPDLDFILDFDLKIDPMTDDAVDRSISTIAKRRPDLIALQLGYDQQEERVYQAVLAQFPTLTLGFSRSRDNSNVTDSIVGLTLNLPVFYRGEDGVRLEEANRQKLWDEYQGRLNQTTADVKRLKAERILLSRQLAFLNQELPRLEAASSKASEALASGDIDALTFADLRSAFLNRKLEALNLEESLIESNLAIETLVGTSTRISQ